jgi:hypothetical protein
MCQRVLSGTSNATLDDKLQGELDSAKVISLRTLYKHGNSACKEIIYFNNYLVLLSLFSLFTCIICYRNLACLFADKILLFNLTICTMRRILVKLQIMLI